MDTVVLGIFLTAAIGLFGSPGPAIAALIAVGRARGFVGGLPYFFGLQLGLATAAGITAAGLFSLLAAFPSALRVMTIAATAYLIYLAYKIASSPVGETAQASNGAHASPAATQLARQLCRRAELRIPVASWVFPLKAQGHTVAHQLAGLDTSY